jgi:hypothetical protein
MILAKGAAFGRSVRETLTTMAASLTFFGFTASLAD